MSNNIKENQIISIVGATTTGKTAVALALAEELVARKLATTVHLLSADSRQVYRALENLTGADLPVDFVSKKSEGFAYPYFTNPKENICIHGVSVIDTHEEWSVAHFQKLLAQIKSQLSSQEILIVAGGTGFYQQQITNEAETISIPQNQSLRKQLAKMSVTELQKQLKNLDQKKLKSMNNADLNNPRRLVRAIEVALYKTKPIATTKQMVQPTNKIFYLELPKVVREEKIEQRVITRFALAKKEVTTQLKNKKTSALAETCTGFAELKQFMQKEINQQTCLAKWQLAEIQYAKRQDTWWKKRSGLIKLDAEKAETIADKIIHTCYI